MAAFIERLTPDTDFTPSLANLHPGIRPPSKDKKSDDGEKDS
jgi:hypothetical protein